MASSSGCTPAASTAWTACTPGICFGITGPASSWISWPKIVSSCGGRPTTVNGQMASLAVIDALDAHHREIVGQAVVAQVIAERSLGLGRSGSMLAGDAEIGLGVDRQLAARGRSSARAGRPGRRQRPDSLMPSGSGITAATVMAGGPPTKTFTRSGFFARRAAAWWAPMPRWIW